MPYIASFGVRANSTVPIYYQRWAIMKLGKLIITNLPGEETFSGKCTCISLVNNVILSFDVFNA